MLLRIGLDSRICIFAQMASLPRFLGSLIQYEDYQSYYHHEEDEPCTDPDMVPDTRIMDLFRRAKTVKRVEEIQADDYGLRCRGCEEGARRFDGPRIKQLVDAAGRY
jgi:hypothetical protein